MTILFARERDPRQIPALSCERARPRRAASGPASRQLQLRASCAEGPWSTAEWCLVGQENMCMCMYAHVSSVNSILNIKTHNTTLPRLARSSVEAVVKDPHVRPSRGAATYPLAQRGHERLCPHAPIA